MIKELFLYLMATLYTLAGINHFISPGIYVRIIPPYLPWPVFLNYAAGAAEMILGIALFFPQTRVPAAWGIILLLIAVFPANLYMYQQGNPVIPQWALLLRLPLQLVLIAWAWWYT